MREYVIGFKKLSRAVLISLVLPSCAHAAECVDSTPGIDSMELTNITIDLSATQSRDFTMLIADGNDERAAGFQHRLQLVASSRTPSCLERRAP